MRRARGARVTCVAHPRVLLVPSRYLPAFQACVSDAKAKSVMCRCVYDVCTVCPCACSVGFVRPYAVHLCVRAGSYNAVNGVPSCADDRLMNQVLRGEFKFDGFVVSDYGAIPALMSDHKFVTSNEDGVAKAITAG